MMNRTTIATHANNSAGKVKATFHQAQSLKQLTAIQSVNANVIATLDSILAHGPAEAA